MKKILILAGISLLLYSFKDKIFGTSTTTDDVKNITAKSVLNSDGTPRLLTPVELQKYISSVPGLKTWFDDNIGKRDDLPVGTDFLTWANKDWVNYAWAHNNNW